MPIKPITTGKEQKSIAALQVGDYIAASYTTDAAKNPGTFNAIGTVDTAEELFNAADANKLTGKVYLMKIAPGCLLCTTMNVRGTNFATLNKANLISGKKVKIGGRDFLMRVPTGRELVLAGGSLHGMMSGDNRYQNFDTAANVNELIQELNNVTPRFFNFNTYPATYATNVGTNDQAQARFVLCYVDNNQSVDVFH
jgi:hypothetical protein